LPVEISESRALFESLDVVGARFEMERDGRGCGSPVPERFVETGEIEPRIGGGILDSNCFPVLGDCAFEQTELFGCASGKLS
jgi:hypothetical protein